MPSSVLAIYTTICAEDGTRTETVRYECPFVDVSPTEIGIDVLVYNNAYGRDQCIGKLRALDRALHERGTSLDEADTTVHYNSATRMFRIEVRAPKRDTQSRL